MSRFDGSAAGDAIDDRGQFNTCAVDLRLPACGILLDFLSQQPHKLGIELPAAFRVQNIQRVLDRFAGPKSAVTPYG